MHPKFTVIYVNVVQYMHYASYIASIRYTHTFILQHFKGNTMNFCYILSQILMFINYNAQPRRVVASVAVIPSQLSRYLF